MSRRPRGRESVPPAPRPPSPVASSLSPLKGVLLNAAAVAVLFLVLVRCLVPISPNLYFDDDPRHDVAFAEEAAAPGETSASASPPPAPDAPRPSRDRKSATAADAASTPPARLAALTLGPSGAAWLDALALAVAGFVLLLHVACGGAIRWLDTLLATVGGAFAAGHLPTHIDNIYIGGSWIGAAALALAALHLAQHAVARRWLVAALVALAVPLLIDAAVYVFIEHAQTLEEFKKNEDAFLKARGWLRGSPEHELFVRRMTLGEPTGAFAFSNVLGSVAAALTAIAAVWAWGLFRRHDSRRLATLPAALALAGGVTVLLTTSKGAPVALALALMPACAAVWAAARGRIALLRFLPAAGVALMVLAIAVVLARGAIGPPDSDRGERSLLFRWHYWQASARMAGSGADTLIAGTGPAGFGEAYPAAKNPLNPEEVRSAHSVFIDWIVQLGIGGWAWSALVLIWLCRAGRAAGAALAADVGQVSNLSSPPQSGGSDASDDPSDSQAHGHSALTPALSRRERGPDTPSPHTEPDLNAAPGLFDIPPGDVAAAVALTALLFGFEAAVKWESLLIPERFLPWAGGMMAFLFVASVLSSERWSPANWLPPALFIGALVLLIHNQIEMSFFQPSSAALAWFVVALAAGIPGALDKQATAQPDAARGSTDAKDRTTASLSPFWIRAIPGTALLIVAIVFAGSFAGPVTRQQRMFADAEEEIRRVGSSRQSLYRAMDSLAQAGELLPDPKSFEWRSRLALEAATNARRFLDTNPPAQMRGMVVGEMRQLTQQAIATLEQAATRGLDTQSLHRQRAMVLAHAADLLNEPRYLNESLAQWQRLVARRPYVWPDRIDLADLLWRMEHRDEAREHYRRALELSDLLYLDPARQMSKEDRQHCEKRAGLAPSEEK